jgi:hypothetical protein
VGRIKMEEKEKRQTKGENKKRIKGNWSFCSSYTNEVQAEKVLLMLYRMYRTNVGKQ